MFYKVTLPSLKRNTGLNCPYAAQPDNIMHEILNTKQSKFTLSSLVFPTLGGPTIATIPNLSNMARINPAWKVIMAMFAPQFTDSMYFSAPKALKIKGLFLWSPL